MRETYVTMALRLVYCFKAYPPVRGGIERYTSELARGAAAAGHEVEVLATAPGHRTSVADEGGVRVVRAGRWGEVASTPISPALVAHLGRRIRTGGIDLVHLQFPFPPAEWRWLLADACRPAGRAATVVTYHADVVRQRHLLRVHAPAVRRLLRRCDAVVAASGALVETSPFLSPIASRVTVIAHGTDLERATCPHPVPAAVAAAAARGPVVLFVGRLRWYKGVDVLIGAVDHLPSEAQVVIVGDGPEGPKLGALAEARGVADRVHLCGELTDDELAGAYRAAAVVALPSTSRAEAFGLTQLEAMATGTPVVSTAVGTGVEFVNQHEVTGLVVPPGDSDALAAALTELLVDVARRRQLGAQAATRVRDHFRLSSMVERTLSLYDDLCRRDRRRVALEPG